MEMKGAVSCLAPHDSQHSSAKPGSARALFLLLQLLKQLCLPPFVSCCQEIKTAQRLLQEHSSGQAAPQSLSVFSTPFPSE